jgi:integrase
MRLGEVRGLQWADIDLKAGILHIWHNWQDMEGIKDPKYRSRRTVPLTDAAKKALDNMRRRGGGKPECLVLPSEKSDKARCCGYFRLALIRQLEGIGIAAEEKMERNISFHSMRHTYITLGRMAGISDMEVQALAGHRGRG